MGAKTKWNNTEKITEIGKEIKEVKKGWISRESYRIATKISWVSQDGHTYDIRVNCQHLEARANVMCKVFALTIERSTCVEAIIPIEKLTIV